MLCMLNIVVSTNKIIKTTVEKLSKWLLSRFYHIKCKILALFSCVGHRTADNRTFDRMVRKI